MPGPSATRKETAGRVLVVDDESSITDLLSPALRYMGYEVSTARTGMAALESASRTPPDVVVLLVGAPHAASAVNAMAASAAAMLTSCGGSSGTPVLTWYINPDSGGQAAIAGRCSTSQYTLTTQVLPTDAGQQRIQLARRLAAGDSGIDLMSIDPAYTAEFANAGYLATIPTDDQGQLKQASFSGAVAASSWKGNLVVAPFWSNVQLLWYRKSFVQKAGLDMSQPVTWNQIIESAAQNGGTVGVQANKYEGYVVWINALVDGAGGTLVKDPVKGQQAGIEVNSCAPKVRCS